MAWILSVVVRLTVCSASVTASFSQLNLDATKAICQWNGYSVWFLSHFWELTAAVFSANYCGVHLSMSELYWVLLSIMLLRFFDMHFLCLLCQIVVLKYTDVLFACRHSPLTLFSDTNFWSTCFCVYSSRLHIRRF